MVTLNPVLFEQNRRQVFAMADAAAQTAYADALDYGWNEDEAVEFARSAWIDANLRGWIATQRASGEAAEE
jgi:hypothetical protein